MAEIAATFSRRTSDEQMEYPAAVNPPLRVVNANRSYPRASLRKPTTSRYLYIAAEIDSRPSFLPGSSRKRRLVAGCKKLLARLSDMQGVLDAQVFVALLIPPGKGEYLKQRAGAVHIAKFDLVILIECDCDETLNELRAHPDCVSMVSGIEASARYIYQTVATNARCIDIVDHTRPGVFLFNFFFAENTQQNLAVWDLTAGWFQVETGLNNSTLLQPVDASASQYSVINHCRWDRLSNILPSLILKHSFRSYVLKNFAANRVAAMPIIYRLA